MNALSIYLNGNHLASAELRNGSCTSFSFNWFGNINGTVFLHLGRIDEQGNRHRWDFDPIEHTDDVLICFEEIHMVDAPTQLLAPLPWIPEKLLESEHRQEQTRGLHAIGKTDLSINGNYICSFDLINNNTIIVNIMWIDDIQGYSMLHINGSSQDDKRKIPKIKFGDKIRFRAVAKEVSRRQSDV